MLLFETVPLHHYVTNLWNYDVDFQETNPNFRCARGAFHVLNVTKFFVVLELLIIPIYMLILFPYWILWIAFDLALMIVTLYALKKEKHRFLWPLVIVCAAKFLIWMVITVFKFIIGIFSTDYFLKLYGQGHHEDFWTRLLIVVAIKSVVLFVGVVLFWKLSVVYTTTKYFEAKTEGTVEVPDEEAGKGLKDKLMQPI